MIQGTKGRNRALNGDVVVVQLMEEGDWKVSKIIFIIILAKNILENKPKLKNHSKQLPLLYC